MQLTERIGYLTVLFSGALMCAICNVGFLREQNAVDDTDPVLRISIGGHERERIHLSHQPNFYVDAVDQETIFQEEGHI